MEPTAVVIATCVRIVRRRRIKRYPEDVMAHNLSRAVAMHRALFAVLWANFLVLHKFGVNSTCSTSRRAAMLQPHALELPHDAFCDSL
jgi:hypothetical protein